MEIDDLDKFEREIVQAEHVLETEYSFEKAEPNYLRCLEIVETNPELRPRIVAVLKSLFMQGKVSDEPIAFLMHKLRWSEIRDWVERDLAEMENPMANGAALGKILAAYSDNWENKEFYDLFSK